MSNKYFRRKRTKRRSFLPFYVVLVLATALVAALFVLWKAMGPTVLVDAKNEETVFYIPTGSSIESISKKLVSEKIISDKRTFDLLADKMNLGGHIYAGKYLIKRNLSNYLLIKQLRSGQEEEVVVTINNIKTIEEICGIAGNLLELDSAKLNQKVRNADFISSMGFTQEGFISFFIPDTYFFNWDTSEEEFLERMQKEYKKFWNEDRKAKAKKLYLSQTEVATLASIVQMEVVHTDEMPTVAGLYLNRIRKGMLLQADPTLKFAANDWSIKRVLNVHKEIESPYNTYKNAGLPPGPIVLPQKSAIDAVLNANDHNYIFMVAKADMSGYHEFTTNINSHNYYANLYRKELNKRKIYR